MEKNKNWTDSDCGVKQEWLCKIIFSKSWIIAEDDCEIIRKVNWSYSKCFII